MKLVLTFTIVVLLAGCAGPVYQPLPGEAPSEAGLQTAPPGMQYYFVQGEVRRPGPMPYLGRTTLVQAVEAGIGFTDSADPRRLVIRRSDGSIEHYDYYRVLRSATNVPSISPGDTVEVKKKRFLW